MKTDNNGHSPELDLTLKSIHQAQDRNNMARTRDLRNLATSGFLQVFDMAPPLIHYNHPNLPGYIDDPKTPHGIVFYEDWLTRAHSVPTGTGKIKVPNPVVECLALIGSSGSVGHTAHSDLDYWVCYNPERLYGEALRLFRQKLQAITDWAQTEYNTEANFYLVNLFDLAQGHIEKNLAAESEGEVAPLLLMEELYRTILMVAGRMPLWCVWPTDRPEAEYHDVAKKIAPLAWTDTPPTYVDLGFPSRPQPQEFLAASMWLARKSEADPFKGILKIVAILEAVENTLDSIFLCDQVKNEIIHNTDPNISVDPYIITIDRVTMFGTRHLSPEHLNLLRISAVLKVLGLTGRPDLLATRETDPTKNRILLIWAQEWGWNLSQLRNLASYDQWSDRERLNQGNELLMMLLNIYMRIANRLLIRYPGQVNAQDTELVPLAARILGRQRGVEATVELLPSNIHRQSFSREMAFRRHEESGLWGIYSLPSKDNRVSEDELDTATPENQPYWHHNQNLIFQSERAAKAAAWLVNNQLYGPDLILKLPEAIKNQNDLAEETLSHYLNELFELFPPVNFYSLNPETIWQIGAQPPVLVVFNLEKPLEDKHILTMDVIYRTGWGEMRHHFQNVGHCAAEADKYLELATLLKDSCGLISIDSLVLSSQNQMLRSFINLKAALTARLRLSQSNNYRSQIDL